MHRQLAIVPYMKIGSTRRHTRDKFYQATPLFSWNVEKIGEPGDEGTKNTHCAIHVLSLVFTNSVTNRISNLHVIYQPANVAHTYKVIKWAE